MATNTNIPVADRIPLPQKVLFSAGVNTEYFASGLLTGVLWMPYFNIGMGLSPSTLGLVLGVLLIWNAFADPIVGNLSDNARTRWGRRRPFIAVGAVLTGCIYPLFWHIPVHFGEKAKIISLILIGVAFFSTYALWAMPYYSLQMELTPNYDERTRLASWMALFGKVSNLVGAWVLAVAAGPWFVNPVTGKGDVVIGMKAVGWIIAAAITISGLLPLISVRERYYNVEAGRQSRDPFWHSIKESATCGPLWSLIGISFFLVLGSTSVGSLGQYVGIYYLFNGDLAAASVVGGYKVTALIATGILLIPVWTWLGEKYDKKKVLITMLVFTMVGHLSNYFFLRPDLPYLSLVSGIFESGAMSAVWLFLPSMKADTADVDELNTRRRREGSVNSFFSWFFKASLTCSVGVGGLVLEFSGFTVKIPHQPPDVLHRMVLIYLFLPILLWSIALVLACWYPLNRRRMLEVRAQLEARRGVV